MAFARTPQRARAAAASDHHAEAEERSAEQGSLPERRENPLPTILQIRPFENREADHAERQRPGAIAVDADLVGGDKRWCEVDHVTYESVKHKNIHVVGDATIDLPVPKSGNVANAMGKICATAVVNLLNGKEPPVIAPGNTCYSWVNDKEAIAVVNAYKIENGKVVQIEQKLTPGKSVAVARNSLAWRASIWNDVLG